MFGAALETQQSSTLGSCRELLETLCMTTKPHDSNYGLRVRPCRLNALMMSTAAGRPWGQLEILEFGIGCQRRMEGPLGRS